ncbi:uncharacterized protein LOC134824948 isoform X2 [Bolinopsis microptera]|uniref:uncharacterized protein LOC134824948 isoform X2 n=1 Tax=Bolinopsis microptera TaxID=2820187 RepID=UPI00307AC667
MTKNADTKFGSLSWVELVPDSEDSPSSRSGHSLIFFEGSLYLFGGKDEYSASNELWQYHTEAAVWTKLSYSGKAPPRLFNHSAILYDKKVFIFGGSLGSSFSLWVFDFSVYEWEKYQTGENWPLNRHSQSVSILNNTVYMYGGYTYLGCESNELWTYDLDDNEWCKVETAETNTPPAMFGHTAVFSGPVMWLFGGSAQREIINSLWSYDTETRQWTPHVKVFSPPPLYYHIAIVTGDVMLIYGGFDEGVKAYTGMWRFNFETEVWTQMVSTELPALAGHAVAVSYVKSTLNGNHSEVKQRNNNPRSLHDQHSVSNLYQSGAGSNNTTLNSSTTTVTALDDSAMSNSAVGEDYGSTWVRNGSLDSADKGGEVVLFDKRNPTRQSDEGYSSQVQKMFSVTPGDIELRPMTTHSTITLFQNSADSHVSLPGMVDEDYVAPDCQYPPPQRMYHSVYENKNVSSQESYCLAEPDIVFAEFMNARTGFNNPLYDDTLLGNPTKKHNKTNSKPKPSAITFYDTQVIGDTKQDQSDSGSQGSRSSLRKKKHFKRGCNTEFYIVGHGQETLPTNVVLYRCKIV